MSDNPHFGSSLDSFLEEEGILEEVSDVARLRVENARLRSVMGAVRRYVVCCGPVNARKAVILEKIDGALLTTKG